MAVNLKEIGIMEKVEALAEQAEYCFEDSIGFLLGRLRNRMASELEEYLRALDISAAQWVILMRIANGMGRTSAELCRCFQYDTGSMTRMLDRLEEKGLVQRQRSLEDRRIVELALTEAGQAIYPQLQRGGKWVAERSLKGISADDVALFKSLVLRMQANLEDGAS